MYEVRDEKYSKLDSYKGRRKNMSELQEKKNQIIKRLKELNEQLTDDVIENATKEEMEQYIELVDLITAKLEILDMIEE